MNINSKRKKLIQFGAGNIGRSFIGQLFAVNGWEVVFIDINESLVDELNKKQSYKVIIKETDRDDFIITVPNVRAVNGAHEEEVINEIKSADLICTSVGSGALPFILPLISRGILESENSIDIILAENIRNGAQFVRKIMKQQFPEDFPIDEKIGLVETSIGKMVPIMKSEDNINNPLLVFAEAYNTLIVDKKGFKGPIPDFTDLKAVENINAYVDRKLFIHNLGHAASAYLGHVYNRNFQYIWQALEIPEIFSQVKEVMLESAGALACEYPDDMKIEELIEHIDDLLFRFQNRSLGDTIFRVGRDIHRKLDYNDRVTGAMRLAQKHNLTFHNIQAVYLAACRFKGEDENGTMFDRDKFFHQKYDNSPILSILSEISHLNKENPDDREIINTFNTRRLINEIQK